MLASSSGVCAMLHAITSCQATDRPAHVSPIPHPIRFTRLANGSRCCCNSLISCRCCRLQPWCLDLCVTVLGHSRSPIPTRRVRCGGDTRQWRSGGEGGEDDGAAARTGVLATRSSDVTDCFTVLASLHGGAGPAGGVGEEDERQAARESRKWIEDRCATGRACV